MIRVVNKKTHKPTPNDIYIGRPSVLGNPFTSIRDKKTLARYVCNTREESIQKYRAWLEKENHFDTSVYSELIALRSLYNTDHDINLVCWCAPLSCHGDILKEFIENE